MINMKIQLHKALCKSLLAKLPQDIGIAKKLQEKGSEAVLRNYSSQHHPTIVAGADVSVKGEHANAAIAVFDIKHMKLLEVATARMKVDFPYIPGLLAFREIPALSEAFGKLGTTPEVTLVDGHGLCHPRRFGLACHFGVAFDMPTIGVGKSRLIGQGDEPGLAKGAWTGLADKGETVGRILRTREGVKPVYISIGHRMDLDHSTSIVMDSLTGYRLPEPIRTAHKAAGELNL